MNAWFLESELSTCFAYSRKPLLDNVDIYTSSLKQILCNSLNCYLIDTKFGTMVHLLILYQPSELYGQIPWYQCCVVLY